METQLTESLTRILRIGSIIARHQDIEMLRPRFMLWAMLHDKDNAARSAMEKLGAAPQALIMKLQALPVPQQDPMKSQENGMLMDSDAKRLIKLATLEAKSAHESAASEAHLLLAMLRDQYNDVRNLLLEQGISYDTLAHLLNGKSAKPLGAFGFPASEDTEEFPKNSQGDGGKQKQAGTKAADGKDDTPYLDRFGTDLTKAAAEEKLDPMVGRGEEVMRMAQILSRRKKNNPIIIGEPGVGKSALVEGLAQLIAKKQVAHTLQDKRIIALGMASIVAGTQYRGQFEERLERLVDEASSHPDVILFIDEIHTIIGAGSAAGTLDAANILKPALARGDLRCIGTTTTEEYKKTIEKDGALERRFQKIMLEPTTEEETLQILRNIKGRYEQHHNVAYTDEALQAIVSLTARYVSDRSFPDKAIDALDEAGSRMHLQNVSVPGDIAALEEQIAQLRRQKMEAARRQQYELAARLRDEAQQKQRQLDRRNAEWRDSLKEERQSVDAASVAHVVSMMSGVPVSQVAEAEHVRLRGMREALAAKVIAQDEAISRVCRAITRSRLGLGDPRRPIGTFMFVGPTGVGKTHLVKTLAEYMFGTRDALIRIDMSEYGEKHTTSRLIGSPPGYVGYEEGGQLTEKVRRHPYSVILLDEIEKAHPDVFNTLLQVMDEGRMTDGNGTTVDFRNTVIILTSNSGTRQLKDFGAGIGFNAGAPDAAGAEAERVVRKALARTFAPEFLNRLDDIVMFKPLSRSSAREIAALEIGMLVQRLQAAGISLAVGDDVAPFIADKGFDPLNGARAVKRTVRQYMEDPLGDLIMELGGTDRPRSFSIRRNGDRLSVEAHS